MNNAYKSFRSPGIPKTDVHTYIEKLTHQLKKLIEEQVSDLGSTKVKVYPQLQWKKYGDIVDALQQMFAYTNTQVEHPA